MNNDIQEGSSTTERFYIEAVKLKQTSVNFASFFLLPLLLACFILAIQSIWSGDYRALSVYAAIGTVSFYFSKKFLSYSDNELREISTRKVCLNKEINPDDYKWIVDCCNKHSELKSFVKKISNNEELKEKELRIFWLELCRIETELDRSNEKEEFLKMKKLLSETIETD